jgi:photosystem II stability/assembly factor-like uncharacterized protein
VAGLGLSLALPAGCTKEEEDGDTAETTANDGDSDTTSDTGTTDETGTTGDGDGDGDGDGFWAVGVSSEMLRVDDGEILDGYPLDLPGDPDLNGIACRGFAQAWVVGDAGTVLRTDDGGQSWQAGTTPTLADLEDVAVGHFQAWAVGEVVLTSPDDGSTWAAFPGDPGVDLVSVTTDHDGEVAFAADTTGDLYRFDLGGTTVAHDGAAALHDVSLSSDGQHVVAVGFAGTAIVSHDGGLVFETLDLGTSQTLRAASVSADGQTVVAVGDDGVVAMADPSGTVVERPAGPGAALFDVHADASDGIQAVGEFGRVLLSDDAGGTWVVLTSPSGRTLFGIDAIGGDGHH